jgi:hypothetical protein
MDKIDLIALLLMVAIVTLAFIISPDNPEPIKSELLCKRVYNIESKANLVLECWEQNK